MKEVDELLKLAREFCRLSYKVRVRKELILGLIKSDPAKALELSTILSNVEIAAHDTNKEINKMVQELVRMGDER